jgi:hypothetical protein
MFRRHPATTRRPDSLLAESDVEKGFPAGAFFPMVFRRTCSVHVVPPSTSRWDGYYVVREALHGLFGLASPVAGCYRGTSLPCAYMMVGWKKRDETRAARKGIEQKRALLIAPKGENLTIGDMAKCLILLPVRV